MPVVDHLVADQFGSYVGKYSERLKVTLKGQVQAQAPLMHLKTVSLVGDGVGISTDAVAACCERGIPIVMLSGTGTVYASLYSAALVGTVLTRREQLLAYYDDRGPSLATAFSRAKIRNQARTLRYWGRNREADDLRDTAAEVDLIANGIADPETDMARLMGAEGRAAQRYWTAAQMLVPAAYQWPGRVGRGATDPVNSLLNYGYGILYGAIERAIVLAGLDPYGGFLHADRPGKPSLVLDLIEEFRQIVVDRTVFGLVARSYTVEQDERGRLSQATRRDYAAKILGQLEGRTRYEGQRRPLRHIIQNQARHVATFVRGERVPYTPFLIEE